MRVRRTVAAAAALVVVGAGGASAATTSVAMQNFVFSPKVAKTALGNTVKWTNRDASAHNSTSDATMPISWRSPNLATGASYTTPRPFTAAGTYTYKCTLHFGMSGSVAVPVIATPATGSRTTTFTVKVATGTAPIGHKYVVQVKRPGATTFATLATTSAAAVTFRPDRTGTFVFRSTFVKTGTNVKSKPSATDSIRVS